MVVVKVREYLRDSTADPAYTFFARGAEGPITGISALHNLVVTPEVLDAFLSSYLDREALMRWAHCNQERVKQLAELARPPNTSAVDPTHLQQLVELTRVSDDGYTRAPTIREVILALESVTQIDADLLDSLKTMLARAVDKQSRLELLRTLTQDVAGESTKVREVVSAILTILDEQQFDPQQLSELFTDRSADLLRSVTVSAKLVEYRRTLTTLRLMVGEDTATESEYQQLLQANPWLFGSEYSELLDRRKWTRDDNLDFMLRRTTDSYLEIIEIKRPCAQSLFNYDASHDSHYPAAPLAEVLGQVIRYMEELDRSRDPIIAKDGDDPLKIRARVIIGRDGDNKQQAALRNLNAHLHRIDVLTFDQLIRIGERVIGVFEGEVSRERGRGVGAMPQLGDLH